MKAKKHILIILLTVAALSAKAQFTAGYSAGYGSYKLNDAKATLDDAFGNMTGAWPEIPFAITDDFPGYINHSADFGYRAGRHEAGIRVTYLTTGGKVAYSDYTGEYSYKLTVNGFRVGLNYRFYQPLTAAGKPTPLSLFAEISPAVTSTTLKENVYLKIYDYSESTSDDLHAAGASILPQVGIKWNIIRLIGVHLSCGYDFCLKSKFKYEGRKTEMEADWSGFRANLGVAVSFGK